MPTTAGLVALDPAGAKLWSSDLPAATGLAVAGGSLYVGTTDGRLVGFGPGIAPSPAPNPAPAPAGTADLALTGIQVPATVSRSSDALVKVTLVNRGGGSASYSLSLRVQPGNLLLGAATGTLSAGETRDVPFTWGTGFMGTDGVKVLLAQVELVGATDSHPEDNILTQPVTVGP